MKEYVADIWGRLVDKVGWEAVLKLAAAKGGRRIYVPQRVSEGDELAQIMGLEGARALVSLYGGSPIVLPADPNGSTKARLRRIDKAIIDGLSIDQVAAIGGVTVRAVSYRKARHRERQPDLFSRPKPTIKTDRA